MNQMKLSSEELRSLPPRPPTLSAASPKRRFVRLGRTTSDGSQHSSASRYAEDVSVRQPSKSRIRRHTNRLSGVFLRSPASDVLKADDPSELSNQITAPGILKIFGDEICAGAHYKSVLATMHSSAKELVKEALERYGLAKEEADSYVLCDTIGSTGSRQWRTEGFRVVGDDEKPLLLQSLWKPREGLARRFEIQRRSWVEERTSKDKDTITAGINEQARKLQKSRSRVASTLIERTTGRNHKLWRSKSEKNLLESDTVNKQDADHNKCREESEREETESSDDNNTQYSIHPPHDCPYLLLLQGCSPAQDFVIYLLAGPNIVFGRRGDAEDGPKPDIHLSAVDILPRHCCFHRHSSGGPTTLCPCQDAVVTKNGDVLRTEVQLFPGDVIGLGQHYLLLFKDPLALMLAHHTCAFPKNQTGEMILCITACADPQGSSSMPCLNRRLPLLQSPTGHSLTLQYERNNEECIIRKIITMGSSKGSPPKTVAFLLCLCLQYSSTCLQISDLRRLLLLIASGVQSAVWEHTKDLSAVHKSSNPEDLQVPNLQDVTSGLCPLVVWMANSLELLHFIQFQLPCIMKQKAQKEQGHDDEERDNKEMDNLASEETAAVLEEVIMLTFQQCVYYVTKVSVTGESGGILTNTWTLLSDCQLHPEISSQLVGYLFFFINASLFNSLMERGSEPGFYQWSRGVRMQANLDLLLDWAHANGLGELALEHTYTLSSAINLLATPRKNLLQISWASLRADYPALSPAQLNHLLSLYNPVSPCRHTWTPSVHDQAAARRTADILERFDTHHPLVLPDGGYQFQLGQEVTDLALGEELDKLKKFISTLSKSPCNGVTATLEKMATIQDHLSCSSTSGTIPAPPPSPPFPSSIPDLEEFNSHGALLLSQRLQNLEPQTRETEIGEMNRSSLDPSCLFTPPNTPHIIDPIDLVRPYQDKWENGDSEEMDHHYDDKNDEVFSLELERSERGLGLALVDTEDTSLRVKGIFVRAVVPDSPAARCGRLAPGDRILAVNGVSLVGLDYQSGKDLIQASGDRLKLLVSRSDWMTKAIQTYR
uniref:Uncharacterized protein n=1 Tax=Mola mola TaxID=94237 RepID=A0A3Q3W3Z8_MOLML